MVSIWFIFFAANVIFMPISALSFPGLTFETTTTEAFSYNTYEIGWIKFLSCEEGFQSSADYSPYTLNELVDIAQYAVTIKILNQKGTDPNNGGITVSTIPGSFEDGNYAIKADICSRPIFSLNNGYELSFQMDPTDIPVITSAADTSDWVGTIAALSRLENTMCDSRTYQTISSARKLIDGIFYDACGNQNEPLYITTTDTHAGFFGGVCSWDMGFPTADFDKDIAIWLGFDRNQDKCCKMDMNDEYQYQQCFTASPTTQPTQAPSVPHVSFICATGHGHGSFECWDAFGTDTMIHCGFRGNGDVPERVYFDPENENKCSVDSVWDDTALSYLHCCDIPADLGWSCNYVSESDFGTTLSATCTGVNEIAIGCQAVGPSCVGHANCGDLINTALGNFDSNGYYSEDITNNVCTAHEQNVYNGVIKVQASCCSITNTDYTLECKQVIGELFTASMFEHSCREALGVEWFVTGCSGYIDGQDNQENGAVVEGFYPSGSSCKIWVDRSDNPGSAGTYPIAQCCRILEH